MSALDHDASTSSGRHAAEQQANPFERTEWFETPAGRLLLRPIRVGDEPELLVFFRDRLSPRSQYLFCPHDPAAPERCLQQFAERISRHASRQDLAYVVEQGGELVGYFYLAGLDRADGCPPTLGIGLADALHGHHIGGAMIDLLLDGARALRLPAVELTHESTNERAGRLYQSRGFAYTGAEEVSAGGARIERVMRWVGAG
jgi:RimJ/RimL family protein N-acetyltransferase